MFYAESNMTTSELLVVSQTVQNTKMSSHISETGESAWCLCLNLMAFMFL